MSNVLARKLSNAGELPKEDLERLSSVIREDRLVEAREDIIQRGEDPENVHLVLEGIACRYKLLPDGSRSIMALLLPGDFCDLHVAILGNMDHNIGTLTECRMVDIPRDTINELLDGFPRIARALWWCTLVDEAVLREWLVNVGKRRADKQIAHLLCELHVRLKAVGRADRFYVPLTQDQLADAVGISPVHSQRVLSQLRQDNLITVQGRRISIPDVAALRDFAEFDGDYLHLDPRVLDESNVHNL